MKKIVLVSMISALFLAGCGAPMTFTEATQVERIPIEQSPATLQVEQTPTEQSPATLQVEQITTEQSSATTQPSAPSPTEVFLPTATLPPVLAAALPYPEPLKVATETDLSYTKPLQPGVIEQKLDIYHPAGNGPRPLVMILPSIANYRKTLAAASLAKKLAGQGMVVFVLDLGKKESVLDRLTDMAKDNGAEIREVFEEISCGLLFAQSKVKEYGGNPDNVILLGYGIGSLYGLDVGLEGTQLESNWETFAAKRGGPPAQTQCITQGEPVKVDAMVTYAGDLKLVSLKEVDPGLAEMLDPAMVAGGNPDLKITLMYNYKMIADDPLEYTTRVKDALTAAGLQVELFMIDTPNMTITSRGPELDWITNAVLQYAKH